MRLAKLAALIAALVATPVLAISPFRIRDIRVEGVQRTEAGTVFSYLPLKVGDTMDDNRAAQAIRALFATGFYNDVRLEAEGDVLVVIVQERPAIAQIDIEGAREFSKDNLRDGLKQVGLAEAKIFDKSLLDRAEKELKRQYQGRGMYSVEVKTTVTPLERNRVAVRFDIVEGEVTRIAEINILGTKAFSERELIRQMQLTTPGWLTWFTKDDQYSRQKLSADLETLRSFYLNRGYLEFNIDSTQVSITPDREKIFITVNVSEGERYTVGDIKFSGDTIVPEAELRQLIVYKPGETFSRQKIIDSNKAISDRLGNDGYSFANVNPVPDINRETRIANFTVFVDPGRRTYVRRINIAGNTKTRDEVIRRELRQLESSWYSVEKIARSKERLERTSFFEEVTIDTPSVPGSLDQVDVNITVKEKNTGQLTFGLGYSRVDRLTVQASVSQSNIFGSGNQLAFAVNNGSLSKVYSISYTNPYWSVDGVSRGFDFYQRDFNTASTVLSSYKTTTTGGGVRFGVPVTEFDVINFGFAGEQTRIALSDSAPQRYQDFVDEFGERTRTLRVDVGYARDTRDSLLFPTKGRLQSLTAEIATPGGDLKYYRISYQHQWLYPVTSWATLSLNGEIGIADGYGGKRLPFFKNYYAGGVESIRGFQSFSLGPRDEFDEPIGGTKRFVGNAEVLFPMPGIKNDKSVRISAFLDTGNVFGRNEKVSFDKFRVSTGLALSWVSPVGPLKFSLARPTRKADSDKVERFQFLLGRTF
jgi:outer membrane protein insertion porin family